MPWAWAASSAAATWPAIASACPASSPPPSPRSAASVGPEIQRIATNGIPEASPVSKTSTTLGCESDTAGTAATSLSATVRSEAV